MIERGLNDPGGKGGVPCDPVGIQGRFRDWGEEAIFAAVCALTEDCIGLCG